MYCVCDECRATVRMSVCALYVTPDEHVSNNRIFFFKKPIYVFFFLFVCFYTCFLSASLLPPLAFFSSSARRRRVVDLADVHHRGLLHAAVWIFVFNREAALVMERQPASSVLCPGALSPGATTTCLQTLSLFSLFSSLSSLSLFSLSLVSLVSLSLYLSVSISHPCTYAVSHICFPRLFPFCSCSGNAYATSRETDHCGSPRVAREVTPLCAHHVALHRHACVLITWHCTDTHVCKNLFRSSSHALLMS